ASEWSPEVASRRFAVDSAIGLSSRSASSATSRCPVGPQASAGTENTVASIAAAMRDTHPGPMRRRASGGRIVEADRQFQEMPTIGLRGRQAPAADVELDRGPQEFRHAERRIARTADRDVLLLARVRPELRVAGFLR